MRGSRMWVPVLMMGVIAPLVVVMGAAPHAPQQLPQPVAHDAEAAGIWHSIQAEESLRSIARRYYGSARMWRTLQTANDIGPYPPVGTRVWVPAAFPSPIELGAAP